MSDLLCIATIVLIGVAQASLQLNLGGLILLYHSSMGKHRRRKTSRLSAAYILGAATIGFLSICAMGFLILTAFGEPLKTEYLIICFGVLAASALVMWLLYYRKGRSTELWLPRSFARFIQRRARKTNDSVEAFSLGILSSFAELPLSIALYLLAANCVLSLSVQFQITAVVGYILICVLPLLILKINVKTGRNLVEIQKWRIRNKAFIRIISGSSFAVLAAFIYTYWIMK